jgi:hypothetical protein
MQIISHPAVEEKFNNYPVGIRAKMLYLRQLILATAEGIDSINELEETLKWGEPSYLVAKGSTLRIDWKAKTPEQYAIYFKCTSKLVPTFKEIYGDTFVYEKNRAIVFQLNQEIPESALRHCISLALTYHRVKELPLLGAGQ